MNAHIKQKYSIFEKNTILKTHSPNSALVLNLRLVAAALFIIIFYWVGMVAVATHNLSILSLTPLNMLLSLLVLNIMYKPNGKLYVAQILVFLFGYFIEVFGVHTGLLFGAYTYMDNLGPKFWETPLIMGVNWVLTVCCSASIVCSFRIQSKVASALLASGLMVLMDVFLEPICSSAGFWVWSLGSAPLQNYIAWFVLGVGLQYGLFKSKLDLNNPLAYLLYLLQVLFFILAYIYL